MKKNILCIFSVVMIVLSFASCNGKNGPKIPATPASDFEYDLTSTGEGIVIFSYLGSDTKIRIPDTIEDYPVVEIANQAFHFKKPPANIFGNFEYDNKFEYIYVPRTVKIVGDAAFCNVSGLDIDIANLEFIGDSCFYNTKFVNTDIVLSKNLSTVEVRQLEDEVQPKRGRRKYYNSTISLKIADQLNLDYEQKYLKRECYVGNASNYFKKSNITSVVFENGIEEIPCGMFFDCAELKTVTIPESVKKIGNSAFNSCKNLENVNFTEGAKIIYPEKTQVFYADWKDGAFSGCDTLSLKTRAEIKATSYEAGFNGGDWDKYN